MYAVPQGGQINLYGNSLIKFARKENEKEKKKKKERKKERKKNQRKKERNKERMKERGNSERRERYLFCAFFLSV